MTVGNKYFKDMRLTLMKTRYIKMQDIDINYIKSLSLKWDDVSEMTLVIPNKVIQNGLVKENLLYDRFYGKRQQLIMRNPDIRFVVTDCSKKEKYYKVKGDSSKDFKKVMYKEMTLTCKSYEYTLQDTNNLILTEDLVRQLYNDGTSKDISDGILNIFEKEQPWTIESCVKEAMISKEMANIMYYREIGKINTISSIARDTEIFNISTNIEPNSDDDCINLTFSYKTINRTDKTTNKEYFDDYVVHKIYDIPYGVKTIKAYYTKSEVGKYCIHYELTMSNGMIIDKYEDFLFCDNMDLTIGKVQMGYETGKQQEQETIKYRTFNEGTYNWLDFLRTNVANAFDNLYFEFDTINFKIKVFMKENYGQKSGIKLSYTNYIKEMNKKDIMDDIVTALTVSSEYCSIMDVNPFLSNTIYNFDYFIRKGMFTKSLTNAWNRYLKAIEGLNETAFDLRSELNTYNKKLIKLEAKRTTIDTNVRLLQLRRTNYIAINDKEEYNGDINRISTQINAYMDNMENILREIEQAKTHISELETKIKDITDNVDMAKAKDSKGLIFTPTLLEEIRDLTIEETANDSTYSTPRELYDYYYKDLKLRNQNPIEFTASVDGLLGSSGIYIPKGRAWSNYIKCGTFFDILEDDELIVDKRGLRLTQIDLIPKENSISLTLTNRDKQNEKYDGVSNVSSSIDKANAYINNYKQIWSQSSGYNEYLNRIFDEGMDLKATSIRGKNNRVSFSFTETGLYVVDNYNEDNQIYLGAGMLCFTKSRWKECSTAIDSEGVVAKNIYGQLILGKKLVITSDNGDFIIGDVENSPSSAFGLQVYQGNALRIFLGTEIEKDGIRHAKLVLYDSEGKEVVLSDEGILQTNQFVYADNIDSNHDIVIPYRSMEGCSRFKSVILTLDFYHYRAYETGASGGGGCYVSGGSTTSAGGGQTTSSGGTTSTNSGGTETCGSSTVSTTGITEGSFLIDQFWIGAPTSSSFDDHHHSCGLICNNHSHNMEHFHYINPHTHSIGTHTHTVSDHTHNFTVGMTIPDHTHGLNYGIYEDPTNMDWVTVFVNGTDVAHLSSGEHVDIAQYLNIGQMNEIRIRNGGNGRIVTNVASKYWQRW